MSVETPVPLEPNRSVEDEVTPSSMAVPKHTQLPRSRASRVRDLPGEDQAAWQRGLEAMLAAARQIGTTMQRLPSTQREWPGGASDWRQAGRRSERGSWPA